MSLHLLSGLFLLVSIAGCVLGLLRAAKYLPADAPKLVAEALPHRLAPAFYLPACAVLTFSLFAEFIRDAVVRNPVWIWIIGGAYFSFIAFWAVYFWFRFRVMGLPKRARHLFVLSLLLPPIGIAGVFIAAMLEIYARRA